MKKTIDLIGKTVPRIGYGTMRLPGKNVMGPPKDPSEALRVLRRAVELGIRVIDTAWYYIWLMKRLGAVKSFNDSKAQFKERYL